MTRRRAVSLFLVIAVLLSALAGFVYSQIPNRQVLPAQTVAPGFYKVVRDVDGDTIIVSMGNKEETIRFIGVDTPETHKPNTPVQCFGPQAADFTKGSVEGKTVRLVADPTGDNRDRYDRLLRYVYLEDGTLLDQQLIEQGYGFAYLSFKFQKSADFATAQAKAEQSKLGLWGVCQPYQEKTGRWQSNNQ